MVSAVHTFKQFTNGACSNRTERISIQMSAKHRNLTLFGWGCLV